jgi:hypothetical protein
MGEEMVDGFGKKRGFTSNLKEEHIACIHDSLYKILEGIRVKTKIDHGVQLSFPVASRLLAKEVQRRNINVNINIANGPKRKGKVIL